MKRRQPAFKGYLSDNAEEPGSLQRAEQTKLSGTQEYYSSANAEQLPLLRTGSTLKGSGCKGIFVTVVKNMLEILMSTTLERM